MSSLGPSELKAEEIAKKITMNLMPLQPKTITAAEKQKILDWAVSVK